MANAFSPTAANILSSLGIKGVTVSESKPGFVPVLGSDGKIDAALIPANAAQLAIPSLGGVAVIDPNTDVAASVRKGSMEAPFKSLAEAAEKFVPSEAAYASKRIGFLLMPGKYEDGSVVFSILPPADPEYGEVRWLPDYVYLIGLGECNFSSSVTLYGIPNGKNLFLQNIVAYNAVTVMSSGVSVTCAGKTYIGTLTATGSLVLGLSSESKVESTNATKVYLSDAFHVGNVPDPDGTDSYPAVKGTTVGHALARLGHRKIRLSHLTVTSSGVDAGSSYDDISAESAGDGYDVFDLRSRDRTLAAAINGFVRLAKKGEFATVTAGTVVADVVKTKELSISSLSLGGYKLEIDMYGYLVVAGGNASPPRPMGSTVLIRDSVTEELYCLGVSDNRLYVEPVEEDSSDSSSYPYDIYILDVIDPDSGLEYELRILDGRLVISSPGSSSS